MFLIAESIWTALDPTAFPASPFPTEMRRGAEQYMLGKGVERCWMEDRKNIGFWFDGAAKRPIEEVIWISPKLVSRWFGFAAAKEKWLDEEKQDRWRRIRSSLEGRMVFLVRLAAYPKRDFLNPDDVERPSTRDLDDLRFMLTLDGADLPVGRQTEFYDRFWPPVANPKSNWTVDAANIRVAPIARLQGRERGHVEGVFWPNVCPLVDVFAPMFPTKPPKGFDNWFGDYHARYFWVEAPAPKSPSELISLELRILSPSKERVAVFNLREPKKR